MSEESILYRSVQALVGGRHLTSDEMAGALGEIMEGSVSAPRVAALLTALRVKGETVEEILGAVVAMRERATRIHPRAERILDTCGTGGDAAGTFNISTAVAFVCAAAGVTVAKHGNRAVSSRVGSADVLESLGLRIDLGPDEVTRCIDEVGIGFLFAPRHHGALRHAAPVRRELGFRTILNLLGPMTNPAGATHQLIGVYAYDRVVQVAEVLGRLGARRALVAHGSDGLDEITLAGPTHVACWDGDRVVEDTVSPTRFGIRCAEASAVAGGSAEHNADVVRSVLAGEPGPPTDIVRLNAGAALWVAEEAPDIAAGVEMATEILRSGAAMRRLEALAHLTRELAS
ncbi:MAG: anthranilate phosphoribosyltransferase [Myxococcota bacterium]